MYSVIAPSIRIEAKDANGNYTPAYWKIRDVNTGAIIYEASNVAFQTITQGVVAGHTYRAVAMNYDNTFAQVVPNQWVQPQGQQLVQASVKAYTPANCFASMTSQVPMIMTFRDSTDAKYTSPSYTTSFSHQVACGAVRAAAVDQFGVWANILPSNIQTVQSGGTVTFQAQQRQTQQGLCPAVIAPTQEGCYGHLSVCTAGNQSAEWKIINLQNPSQILTGSGLSQQYQNLPCGYYQIIFEGNYKVYTAPGPVFEIRNGQTTSLLFAVGVEPQPQPPPPPSPAYPPGAEYPPQYPVRAFPEGQAPSPPIGAPEPTWKMWLEKYWWQIALIAGAGGLIIYSRKKKKGA